MVMTPNGEARNLAMVLNSLPTKVRKGEFGGGIFLL
jgi:hypothetical protein